MNLLYLSYWSINDGLTSSTVIPNLKILGKLRTIDNIVFCSIERNEFVKKPKPLGLPKVIHIPLRSKNYKINLVNKIIDFLIFRKQLLKLIEKYEVDALLCRSSLAGALGYLVHKKTGIPFLVESFEPHADYMREGGQWSRFNPKYLAEKYWEKKQKEDAEMLMPVSNNYVQKLVEEGVPIEKIRVMPCCVPLQAFAFSKGKRAYVRKKLGIPDQCIVGIYVGKFGAIYYKREAFLLFKRAFDFFGQSYFLIILTPEDERYVELELDRAGIDKHRVFTGKVPYEEVPHYLSAADFAFSPIRKSPSRLYCSPIKNGEYWAGGLPILTPEGIGDDSAIIEENGVGAIFDIYSPSSIVTALQKVNDLLKKYSRSELAEMISSLAEEYRNFEVVEEVYGGVFKTI